jgi:hypothetical protein
MRTIDNVRFVVARVLRAACIAQDWQSVLAAADELEALAGEGPSDGEMLEWVCENLHERRKLIEGGVAVRWIDSDFDDRWTKGKDARDAIAKAMIEDKVLRDASDPKQSHAGTGA